MFSQMFDRTVYGLMAAVLVVPEPTTFVVCTLLLAGLATYGANQALDLLRPVRSPAPRRA